MAFGSFFCCGLASDGSERGKKNVVAWRIFSLKELRSATNNFNYDNKLGEGGFGSVYWGQLWDGSQIAVKRLKMWSNEVMPEFAVQLEILGKIRHKNLLTLRGYCAEGQERLLVYDYMTNGSLFSHLHGLSSAECLLDWHRRVSIAIGSAEGIVYLHHHVTPDMIHGDIKSSNVLLDSDFRARIADFGFAKFNLENDTLVNNKPKSNIGYLPPEYVDHGKASKKSDVYSFGILLLELISGKKPIEKMEPLGRINKWALGLAREKKFKEIADTKLNGEYVEAELRRMVVVALVCSHSIPEKRPTMLEVVDFLKGASKETLSELENDALFRPEIEDSEGLSDKVVV